MYDVLTSIPTDITKVLRYCFVAIWLLLLFLCVPTLLFFSLYGTQATGEVMYKNGSVLVGNNGFDTFFQNTLNITTSLTSTTRLFLFRHSCSNLPTTKSTISQVVHRNQLLNTETNIPLYYDYLVDGSTVCFHANITGEMNLTDCAAAIYVLDDWHAYSSAFIDGKNITANISKYCLNISSTDQPNLPRCFRVPYPGFFFFGAYIPGTHQKLGVELAIIQTVANRILYNTSTLRHVCEMPPGDGAHHCIIHLLDEKISTSIRKKMCILMTAEGDENLMQMQTLHSMHYTGMAPVVTAVFSLNGSSQLEQLWLFISQPPQPTCTTYRSPTQV